MKNRQDLIREYGKILRWTNGGGNEAGETWDYTFYIENVITGTKKRILSDHAIEFIKSKKLDDFKNQNMYDTHIALFELEGVKPLPTFAELMIKCEVSSTQLEKLSGIPKATISDLKRGLSDFRAVKVETALKLSKGLNLSIERIYSYLYE